MSTATKRNSRPITILLVDDDPDCRLLIRDIVEAAAARARVREAADGQEALDYLRRVGRFAAAPRPALIYLDVEMPGRGGLEVLAAIKADPQLRDIPVVMLTGVADRHLRRRAIEGGAEGFVVKPADPRRFLHTVDQSVRHWVAPPNSAPQEGQKADD